jgi:hypothetical protein
MCGYHIDIELNELRKRIAELEAEIKDGWMVSHEIMEKRKTELEGALEEIDEPLSDAWALSVDYDGFKEAESLKSLIDDIIVQVQKGRSIARTALGRK